MTGEDWGILIGILVAIGSVVGPWMWSVNSKLARIASYGRAWKQMAQVLLRHDEQLRQHAARLDEHDERLAGHDAERRRRE